MYTKYLSILLSALALSLQVSSAEIDLLEANESEYAKALQPKFGSLCNAGGYHCTGQVSDLVKQFYVNEKSDTINLYISYELANEIACTPVSGVLIPLPASDPGQQNVINQLHLALGLGARISLRIKENTDPCELAYTRLYIDSIP